MGLSSLAIQSHAIESHYVIECHPDVIAYALRKQREAVRENRLHLLGGFWQDVTPLLAGGVFDGILFDTYPLCEEEVHCNHIPFLREAHRLLRPGGVLTYYSDETSGFSPRHLTALCEAGFSVENISKQVCDVNPPPECEYWTATTIMAPIVRKVGNPA